MIPPRPTISNLQWIAGTQYTTPSDMDTLSEYSSSFHSWLLANTSQVGGPDRPPSKRMIEQMRADEQERRLANRQGPSSPSGAPNPGPSDEGYWAYMQRQVQERTANLGIMGDSIDKLEDNSSSWANDVNKFVSKQKKKAVMGGKFRIRSLSAISFLRTILTIR